MRRLYFVIAIFWGLSAYGYHPRIHRKMTLDAVGLIKICSQSRSRVFNLKTYDFVRQQAESLVKGTVNEDTTQLVSRARNWHFYDYDGKLRKGSVFHESLDKIYKQRNNELAFADRNASAEALGRTLHYVQDMFVPAHVVPVFHGKPFAATDSFDDYEVNNSEKEIHLSKINCEELVGKAFAMREQMRPYNYHPFDVNRMLLDFVAKATLKRLDSPIGSTGISWSHFWLKPNSTKLGSEDTASALVALGVPANRFGRYNGNFGSSDSKVTSSDFHNFAMGQYIGGVAVSAQFILMNAPNH